MKMKSLKYYAFVVLLFAVFIFIMNGGDLFKKPLGSEDNFMLYMNRLEDNISITEWQTASVNYEKLLRAWKKIIPRIQYSVEKDEINAIEVNLARLKSCITSQDKALALLELSEAREHWHNLNR
jgi:hypothetical protein